MKVVLYCTLVVSCLVLCGCNSERITQPNNETGITGYVWRGPTNPVCSVNDPCEDTFAATFFVYQSDTQVSSFTTGSDGFFKVLLPAGDYTIIPADDAPIISPSTQIKEVSVIDGKLETVRLDFDTGIV